MAIIGISGKIGSGKDLTASIIQYWLWKSKVESAQDTSIHYTIVDFINNPSLVQTLSKWDIVKYADKLKDCMCLILGCTREQWENDRGYRDKELGPEWWYWKNSLDKIVPYLDNTSYNKQLIKLTPRNFLLLLGTECGRQIIHPNIWVNATMVDYKANGSLIRKSRMNTIKPTLEDLHNSYPNWIITDVRFPNELQAIKDKEGILIRVNRPHYGTSMVDLSKAHESETALDTYEKWDYIIDNNGTIEDLVIKVKEILLKERLL